MMAGLMAKIITLLTDFGSFYPAQMKGVILSRLADKAQDLTFVDIAHDIPPQDVRAGAFALLSSACYFPPGTIHLAVVDPGVGMDRMGLVVESDGQIFVGPDNGLLLPAARSLGTPGNPPQSYKIASLEAQGLGLGLQHIPRPGRFRSGGSPAGLGQDSVQYRPQGEAQRPEFRRSEEDGSGNRGHDHLRGPVRQPHIKYAKAAGLSFKPEGNKAETGQDLCPGAQDRTAYNLRKPWLRRNCGQPGKCRRGVLP